MVSPLMVTGIAFISILGISAISNSTLQQSQSVSESQEVQSIQMEKASEELELEFEDSAINLRNLMNSDVKVLEIRVLDDDGNLIDKQKIDDDFNPAKAKALSLDQKVINRIEYAKQVKGDKFNSIPVVWDDSITHSFITISDNELSKTGKNGWNTGSASELSIKKGNGFVTMTAEANKGHRMIGLGDKSTSNSYVDIDYAIFLLSDNRIRIYENGAYKGQYGTFIDGDQLRVALVNGKVHYFKNNEMLYVSQTPVTPGDYPIYVDAAVYSTIGTLTDVMVSSNFK